MLQGPGGQCPCTRWKAARGLQQRKQWSCCEGDIYVLAFRDCEEDTRVGEYIDNVEVLRREFDRQRERNGSKNVAVTGDCKNT